MVKYLFWRENEEFKFGASYMKNSNAILFMN
jgi:hypothetical protein